MTKKKPDDEKKGMMFNLKQLISRNGGIMMSSVERLLESTSINATDVETGQTLLEYACRTSDISLAKFCFRRGASLVDRTSSGDTAFNVSAKNKCYKLMEFLCTYGVPINYGDAEGRTALHIAVSQNDVDGICRLIEWGADVNSRDNHRRTPLHYAAIGGHAEVAELLLELGASLNATDDKEFTAVAHAEANDHFWLMDRLVQLGGKGYKLATIAVPMPKFAVDESTEVTARGVKLGRLPVSPLYLKKTSGMGRLGKVGLTTTAIGGGGGK